MPITCFKGKPRPICSVNFFKGDGQKEENLSFGTLIKNAGSLVHSSWFFLCQCMGRKDEGCPAKKQQYKNLRPEEKSLVIFVMCLLCYSNRLYGFVRGLRELISVDWPVSNQCHPGKVHTYVASLAAMFFGVLTIHLVTIISNR